MKTFKNIAIALCATLMLAACGGGSPEAVAEKFQKAMVSGDFDKAASYATKASAPMLKTMGSMLTGTMLDEFKEQVKGAKIRVVSSEIDGDTATVTMEVTNADGETEEETCNLVKEDGEWKVGFEK